MPGLTQADVTPNAVEEEEQEEQKDEGYQWGRWLKNPGNELRFIGKGVQNLWNDTERKLLEASNTPGVKSVNYIALPGMPPVPITERDDGRVVASSPAAQEILAGAQEATVDVALQGISLGQQFYEEETADLQGREAVQTDTRDFKPLGLPIPVGALLEDSKDGFAEFMGAPKRYELGDGSIFRDISSNVTSTIYTGLALSKLGLTPGARPNAFTGMRVNPLASKFKPTDLVQVKGPWGAYWRRNPEWARTAARWLSFGGMESFGVTLISDQTEAGYADPGDSQATATMKSLIPNAGGDLAMGTGFLAPAAVAKSANAARKLPRLIGEKFDVPSSIARTRQAAAVAQEVKDARKWTTDNGLQTEAPDGAYEFTAQDPWTTKPVSAERVRTEIDLAAKASEGAAPTTPRQALDQLEGQPRVEIESAWDSELPEIDTIKRALDRLEPIELRQIAVELEDGQALVNALSRRLDNVEQGLGEIELGSPVVWPAGGNIPIEAMFMSFDTPQLRAMAKANPAMTAMLRANGQSPLTASRTQMIQSLVDLQKKGAPIAAPVKAPETAIPPAEADGLKAGILRRAMENGEVRPSATEIPDLPEPPAKDPSDMTVAEQLIEDDRLSGEWTQIDNAKAERNLRETREADGYYQKSEAEQAAAGKYDGWDEPAAPEPVGSTVKIDPNANPERWAAQFGSKYGPNKGLLGINEAQWLEAFKKRGVPDFYELAGGQSQWERFSQGYEMPEIEAKLREFVSSDGPPAADSVSAPTQQFTLPADVSKSAPRFGMAKITFANDLDRAAYIIRNKAKASKGEARIIKALEEQGYDIAEIRARGDEVKTLIQDVIEEQTGSRRAPQSAMELEIPDTDTIRDSDVMMSAGGPQLPPIDPAEAKRMVAALEEFATARVNQVQDGLRDVAEQIFGKDQMPAEFDFDAYPKLAKKPKAWGGDGKEMIEVGGSYTPLDDVIQINNIINTPMEGSYGLKEIMAHESMHRLQTGYFTPAESKMLSNVFGKQDLEFFSKISMKNSWGIQPIEIQSVAFQKFYTMNEQGLTRLDLVRDVITSELDQKFPMKRGSWKRKLTIEALSVLREGWMRIIGFRNRAMNYIEGNGFRNVYDIFDDAYQGRLTANRKMENFTQILAEAERVPQMEDAEFNQWLKENPDFSEKYARATVRQDYWDLWKGKANQSIAKLDSDIAALKQQAIDGGC